MDNEDFSEIDFEEASERSVAPRRAPAPAPTKGRLPDFLIYGRASTPSGYAKVGAAWRIEKNRKGAAGFSIRLDAGYSNQGDVLYMWPCPGAETADEDQVQSPPVQPQEVRPQAQPVQVRPAVHALFWRAARKLGQVFR